VVGMRGRCGEWEQKMESQTDGERRQRRGSQRMGKAARAGRASVAGKDKRKTQVGKDGPRRPARVKRRVHSNGA